MRSLKVVVLVAVLLQFIALGGCGWDSSHTEATPPDSFAPPPTKKRRKAESTAENAKQRRGSDRYSDAISLLTVES